MVEWAASAKPSSRRLYRRSGHRLRLHPIRLGAAHDQLFPPHLFHRSYRPTSSLFRCSRCVVPIGFAAIVTGWHLLGVHHASSPAIWPKRSPPGTFALSHPGASLRFRFGSPSSFRSIADRARHLHPPETLDLRSTLTVSLASFAVICWQPWNPIDPGRGCSKSPPLMSARATVCCSSFQTARPCWSMPAVSRAWSA